MGRRFPAAFLEEPGFLDHRPPRFPSRDDHVIVYRCLLDMTFPFSPIFACDIVSMQETEPSPRQKFSAQPPARSSRVSRGRPCAWASASRRLLSRPGSGLLFSYFLQRPGGVSMPLAAQLATNRRVTQPPVSRSKPVSACQGPLVVILAVTAIKRDSGPHEVVGQKPVDINGHPTRAAGCPTARVDFCQPPCKSILNFSVQLACTFSAV